MISIDGYADIERIGKGGLGDVYRATQISTGGTVAVKVLRDVSDESVAWHRTRRELTALVSLAGHANVIQLLEVLDLPAGPALVMEYAPGGSVAELMLRRDRPLTVGETALVGRQTATALDAAHARGIVHRDVKPQNLLIDAYGQVKLCDFGIAAMARSEEFQTRTSAISMRYASPEDLDDDVDVGSPSDVYSLGATMLHMARGAPPTLKERLAPWAPPSTDDEQLAVLDAVIAACLHPSPAERPTAAQVADELERLGWSIDERNRSLAFESVDLVDAPTDEPTDEHGVGRSVQAGPVASAIAALGGDARGDEVATVQRPAANADSQGPPAHPDAEPGPVDDTVYRPDRRPQPPEVATGRERRWPILLAVAALTTLVVVVAWPRADGSPPLEFVDRPAALTDIRELDWPIGPIGECLVQFADALQPVGCDVAHDLQRIAIGELDEFPPDAEYDAESVDAAVSAACDTAFESFVGVPPGASELQVPRTAPSATTWDQSVDRTFQCLVGIADRRLVGDAEGSER